MSRQRQRRKPKPRRKVTPVNPVNSVTSPGSDRPPIALSPHHDFDDFAAEREITWSADSPTSGEKALAIIVLAAAAGIAGFILWILSFS